MFSEEKTLIIVYKEKDEVIVNQLRKLIETNDDDTENDVVIGVEDGTVKIVTWHEKVWLDHKKAGDIDDKVLFLGDEIKGVKNLIPVIDEKYNEFGIHYGWAGKQAVLYVDEKALIKKELYQDFLFELKEKTNVKVADKTKMLGINRKTALKLGGLAIPHLSFIVLGSLIADVFGDSALVRKQQFFLGVTELYTNHLDAFMKQ